MPFVTIKGIEGAFSTEMKRDAIERVTEAMVAVEGEALRPYTFVVFEEVKGGDWGIGGKTLTAQDVKAIQAAGTAKAAR
jgi:4-oxalocrotonate tautomerase